MVGTGFKQERKNSSVKGNYSQKHVIGLNKSCYLYLTAYKVFWSKYEKEGETSVENLHVFLSLAQTVWSASSLFNVIQ